MAGSRLPQGRFDAVVIGAGPNGLAGAVALARAGLRVLVAEAGATVGGGTRTAPLTLPGFVHDVCSAIHPLGIGSPFLRTLPLARYGLRWIHPPLPLAHPLDDGSAVVLDRSPARTAAGLGPDARAYRRLFAPLLHDWPALLDAVLGPLRVPAHPWVLARFGLPALLPARLLATLAFRGERARALFAGMSAHAMLPLEEPLSAAAGLLLGVLGHAVGWPLAAGGSQAIADAMAAYLTDLGSTVITGRRVHSLDELPRADIILCDIGPRELLRIAGERLPAGYRRQLRRFRYGPGAYKVDYALDGPIPWIAPECARAGTVHLGGTLPEIAAAERAASTGRAPERPFVLVAQQSLFDPARAPAGCHTAWAYCHVPNASRAGMTAALEAQIERFAPGFGRRILARAVTTPRAFEHYNPNYVGGDINAGRADLRQFFTRPVPSLDPYRTPLRGLYLCAAATPPGGGVHGMCGYHAAQAALHDLTRA